MSAYYVANVLLCVLSSLTLCLLVHENARIRRGDKKLLYLTYILISCSALAEFFGVYLDGRENLPSLLIRSVKCLDYILTPMAGGSLALQVRHRNRWNFRMIGLLGFNTLLQIVSSFFGWMVQVDEHNHYSHGPLYPLYLGLCVVTFLYVTVQFLVYGKAFRSQNKLSIFAIIVLIGAGVAIQEVTRGEARTAYIALALATSFLFIHYTELSSLSLEERIELQQIQLDTDALTGLSSRFAYVRDLDEFDRMESLPNNLAIYMIDINGLKQINDRFGHKAGDELISATADILQSIFGAVGKCYRTGGDEFVVMARLRENAARDALRNLEKEIAEWTGSFGNKLSISTGCVVSEEAPDQNCSQLIHLADQRMYASKTSYYQAAGHDRRQRR